MSVPACRAAVALLTLALLPACSIKHFAVNALGNALAEGGSSYARDADPGRGCFPGVCGVRHQPADP